MKLMQLIQLDKDAISTVKGSFDNLPHTDHKDGKYRLRRYSQIELRTSFWNASEQVEITHLTSNEFTQSSDYNLHQGDKKRVFDNLEESTVNNEGFKEICLEFKRANELKDGIIVDVHQMRVVTLDELDGSAPVAPEGRHQDGYDCIGMIGIQRNNIKGGELHAYPDSESPAFLTHILRDGQMLLLADKILWHYATDIIKKHQDLHQGYGDWFVLCANRI